MAQPDALAEQAGALASETVSSVVEGAVAQVQAAADATLERAEAAEAALEVMHDAAHRDALHDEIVEVQEEGEEWRDEHNAVHDQLNHRIAALEDRCNSLQSQLAEASQKLMLVTVSTPPTSPEGTTPAAPGVTVQAINPDDAAPAPMPAPAAAPANRRHWI